MTAQLALGLCFLLFTAIWELFEHNLLAARYPNFAVHKLSRCARGKWSTRVRLMLLMSLLLLPRMASATG